MKLDALLERENLVPVASLFAGGYDWSEIHVYYKADARRFFWLEESGCSCNFFGDFDPYELGDFQDGGRDAAIKALKEFSHYDGDPAADDVNREVDNVRNWKP